MKCPSLLLQNPLSLECSRPFTTTHFEHITCLSTYVHIIACKYVCIHPCLSGTHIHAYTHMQSFMDVCLHTKISTCIQHICMSAFIHIGIHPSIHTCMKTHACLLHTYRHSCLPLDMHTYIQLIHFSVETYIILDLSISPIFRFAYFQNFHTSGNIDTS